MNYGLKSDVELIFSVVGMERGRNLREIRSGRLYSVIFLLETGLHLGRTEPYTKFTPQVRYKYLFMSHNFPNRLAEEIHTY